MTDIDKRIAVEVMGWRQYKAHTGAEWCEPEAKTKGLTGTVRNLVCNWSPSTRIDHAWEAVKAMLDKHGFVFSMRGGLGTFDAAFNDHCSSAIGPFHEAETAPLAICKAALAAVEKQE